MSVLVPYDGSDQSEHALQFAAHQFGDEQITLLHILVPFADHTAAGGYTTTRYEQFNEEADEMLAEAIESLPDGVAASKEVRYGRPVHEIIRYLEDSETAQIVIGSHGRDGAKRLLLGSVAETVVRRATVPVTVVREQSTGCVAGIDHILVAFDGSDQSQDALKYALETYPSAEITVLYVVYPPEEITGPATSSTPTAILDWSERIEEHTSDVFDRATEASTDSNRSISTEHRKGDPIQEIIEFADQSDVDHIVMGSHGRDGLERLLIGSVAETVVRRAPTSVTVVR